MEQYYKKKDAIQLRKRGLSYREIGIKTGVAKSTLSYWLKDIALSKKHRERLYTKQIEILSRGSKSIKEKRAREIATIIETAKKEIKIPISKEAFHLFGTALYWAEGSKGKRIEITNSDPYLIVFMVQWFEKIFHVKPNMLTARLNIYEQQNDPELKKFWSDITGIPFMNFKKSFIKPKNKNYKKNTLYYGTIRVEMPKSTNNRHRIFAWTQSVMDNTKPHIAQTQKKWQHLLKIKRPVNLKNP